MAPPIVLTFLMLIAPPPDCDMAPRPRLAPVVLRLIGPPTLLAAVNAAIWLPAAVRLTPPVVFRLT